MSPITDRFHELDPRLRRVAPFIVTLLLGLLAWQMPVLAARDDLDELAAPEPASSPRDIEVVESPSTTAPISTSTTVGAPLLPVPSAAPFPAVRPAPVAAAGTPSDTVAPSPPASAGPAATPGGPLRVTKSTWAQSSVRRGTPLEEAPDDVLPVEMFTSSPSRQAYVEIRGADTVLTLRVSGTAPDGINADPPGLAACPILTGFWEDDPGQSFESAPPHDPENCVTGAATADGSAWLFDLGGHGRLETHPGFAIVPTAPGTYSVWFSKP